MRTECRLRNLTKAQRRAIIREKRIVATGVHT
jgi:hypothetical protein